MSADEDEIGGVVKMTGASIGSVWIRLDFFLRFRRLDEVATASAPEAGAEPSPSNRAALGGGEDGADDGPVRESSEEDESGTYPLDAMGAGGVGTGGGAAGVVAATLAICSSNWRAVLAGAFASGGGVGLRGGADEERGDCVAGGAAA